MADLLSKLRMLDAAPRRPAPAARGAQEGCYRSQATFSLPIFTDLRHIFKINITAEFAVFIPVHTDINHNRTLFYHIGSNKLRSADCGYEYICL